MRDIQPHLVGVPKRKGIIEMFAYQSKLAAAMPNRQWLTTGEYIYKIMSPEIKLMEITKAEIYSNYVQNGGKPIYVSGDE